MMKLVEKVLHIDELKALGLIDTYDNLDEKKFWKYAEEQKMKGFAVKLDNNNTIESLGLSILDNEPTIYNRETIATYPPTVH